MKKNKTKKKYEDGGELNPALTGLIGTGLSAINPALGAIAMPLLNMFSQQPSQILNDHFNQVKTSPNPYGYEKGGQLGYEDLIVYNGPSHKEGGIPISNDGNAMSSGDAMAEVEGGETVWRIGDKRYVFSQKLKI